MRSSFPAPSTIHLHLFSSAGFSRSPVAGLACTAFYTKVLCWALSIWKISSAGFPSLQGRPLSPRIRKLCLCFLSGSHHHSKVALSVQGLEDMLCFIRLAPVRGRPLRPKVRLELLTSSVRGRPPSPRIGRKVLFNQVRPTSPRSTSQSKDQKRVYWVRFYLSCSPHQSKVVVSVLGPVAYFIFLGFFMELRNHTAYTYCITRCLKDNTCCLNLQDAATFANTCVSCCAQVTRRPSKTP